MRHSQFLTFGFILILLLSSGYAINAFLVSSANYSLLNEHIIDVSEGNVTDLRLNMSIPLNSEIVLSSYEYALQTDGQSNPYIYVLVENPSMPFNFSAYLKVRAKALSIKSLSDSYVIPDEYSIYLVSTPEVPSNDKTIQKLALDTTKNYSSDFEKISALAYWVNNNLEYNLSYVDKNLSVHEILNERRGVCGDYSLLFAALSRSLGYPTRFVNGYAYSSVQEQWVGHAWNEVYLGKWISVDSTWLEVGALDATHVPVSKLDTNEYSLASVSALVYPPNAKLFWHGTDEFRNIPANNLMVDTSQLIQPSGEFELGITHERISQDSDFLIYLKYPAQDYRILRAYLAPCASDSGDIVEFRQTEIWSATKTGEDTYLVWEGHSSKDIEKNVRYRCPLTINSDYLTKAVIDVEIQYSDTVLSPINATFQSSSVGVGESQIVNVQADKKSRIAYLLTDEFFEQKELDGEGIGVFEFSSSNSGQKKAYVWTDTSSPISINYVVSSGESQKLFDIYTESFYREGEASFVKIKFISNYSLLDKIIAWNWAGQSSKMSLENLVGDELTIPFTADSSGSYIFSASLLDGNMQKLYSQSKMLQSYAKSLVSVNMLRITKINKNVSIVRLMLNTSGPVESIWVLVDGKKYELASNEIQLDLLPKSYIAKVVWQDSSGQQSEIPVFIRAPTADDEAVEVVPGVLIRRQNANLASVVGQGVAALIILAILVFVHRHRSNPFA